MSKGLISLLFLGFLGLTACSDSERGIDYIYDGYGYYGDDLAGRDYAISYIELGIDSGDFFEVDSSNFQISFDGSASLVAGNKNCNEFSATSNWVEFGLSLEFFVSEDFLCGPDSLEFPEDIFLNDVYQLDVSFELGRQVVVLYSERQDIAIYLMEL